MFKVGDIVVPKDKTSMFGQYIYVVNEIHYVHMQVVEFKKDDGLPGLGFYVQQDGWEYEKQYSRSKKINKICSKLVI